MSYYAIIFEGLREAAKTYTEGSRPEPVFLEASESSVYDLKEHPDFKFRPGAIVIRDG